MLLPLVWIHWSCPCPGAIDGCSSLLEQCPLDRSAPVSDCLDEPCVLPSTPLHTAEFLKQIPDFIRGIPLNHIQKGRMPLGAVVSLSSVEGLKLEGDCIHRVLQWWSYLSVFWQMVHTDFKLKPNRAAAKVPVEVIWASAKSSLYHLSCSAGLHLFSV